ncbi:MAG: hypothetical protein ACLFNS_11415 [Desulfobacterales bacterium]
MPSLFYKIIITAAFFAYLSSLIACCQEWRICARVLSCLGLVLILAAAVAGGLENFRLPLYGLYETSLHMALVLSLCLEFAAYKPGMAGLWSPGRIIVSALLGLAWTAAGEFRFDFYIYQSLTVQLFFFLRVTAAGVSLFAFLLFAAACKNSFFNKTGNHSIFIQNALKATVAAGILFLFSELSGTLWCMRGWGDIWHWSANFFESAALFLLLMLPLHIPGRLKKNMAGAWVGMVCTLLVVLAVAVP